MTREITYTDLRNVKNRGRHLTNPETEYLETTFIGRELVGENEAVKQPQRERVADFLLSEHPDGQRMRLFSLPGIRWSFENYVEQRRPGLQTYVAVERHRAIFERMVSSMPGGTSRAYEEVLSNGPLSFYESASARLFWAEAGTILDLGRVEKGSKAAVKRWVRNFKKWTAVWLDFQGPLCTETIRALKRLGQHLDYTRTRVPVAVTLLLAREPREATTAMDLVVARDCGVLERRVRFVQAMIESGRYWGFEPTGSWEYASAGGAPMGVVMGIMHRKHAPPLEEDAEVHEAVERPKDRQPASPRTIVREGDTVVYQGKHLQVIGFEREKLRLLERCGKLVKQHVVSILDLG